MSELIALLTFCAFLAVVFAGLAPQLRQDTVYRAVTIISFLWICLITFIPLLRLCVITASAIVVAANRLLEIIIWRFASPPNKWEVALFLFTLICMVCYFQFIGQLRVYVADVQKCLPIEFGDGEIEVDAPAPSPAESQSTSNAHPQKETPQQEKAPQNNPSPDPESAIPRRQPSPDDYDSTADWRPRPKKNRDPKRIAKRSAPAVVKSFERSDSAIEFVPVTSHPALSGMSSDSARVQHIVPSNAGVVIGSATPLLTNVTVPAASRPPTLSAGCHNLEASQPAEPNYAMKKGVSRSAATATAGVSKTRRPGYQSVRDRRQARAIQKDGSVQHSRSGRPSTSVLDENSVSEVTSVPDQKATRNVPFASEVMVRQQPSPLSSQAAGPEAISLPPAPPSSSTQDSSNENASDESAGDEPVEIPTSPVYKPWIATPHMSLVPQSTEETEDDDMSIASLDHGPPSSPTIVTVLSPDTVRDFEIMFNGFVAPTRLPAPAKPSADPSANQPQNGMAQEIRGETTAVAVSPVRIETVALPSKPASPITHKQQEEHSQQETDSKDVPMEGAETIAPPAETTATRQDVVQKTEAGPEVSMGDGEAAPPPSTPDGEEGDMPQGSSIQQDNDIAMTEDEARPTTPNPDDQKNAAAWGIDIQPDQDISMEDASTTASPAIPDDRKDDMSQRVSSKPSKDISTADHTTAASSAIPVEANSDTDPRDSCESSQDIPKSDATPTPSPSSNHGPAPPSSQGVATPSQPSVPAPSLTTTASPLPPAVQTPSVAQRLSAAPSAPIPVPSTAAMPSAAAPLQQTTTPPWSSIIPRPPPFTRVAFGHRAPNFAILPKPQAVEAPDIQSVRPASNPLLGMSDSNALAQISTWLLESDTYDAFKDMAENAKRSWAWAHDYSFRAQELYWQLHCTLEWATEPSSWDSEATEYYKGNPCPLRWRPRASSLVPALQARSAALDELIMKKGLSKAVGDHHRNAANDMNSNKNVQFLPERGFQFKVVHLLKGLMGAK